MTSEVDKLSEHLFRENSGKMVAVLSRLFGVQHIDPIMDVVQDTFEAALVKWRFGGVPENPEGWLMKVARNKAINYFKRNNKLVFGKTFELPDDDVSQSALDILMPHEIQDSQLQLLLLCCTQEIPEKNKVIITLNILCGFGVKEIAKALMMNDEAVKKAISRTKAIFETRIETQLEDLKSESYVTTMHTALYLMFNEGYKTTRSASAIDHGLCFEAIRLCKLLLQDHVALPRETRALLALMFFSLARFPSRISAEGDLVTIEEQNRSQWNKTFIEEGFFYLRGLKPMQLSRFYLEALISSQHCIAQTFDSTDWKTIVFLYEQLEQITASPFVKLNKAVAKGFMDACNGLKEIELLKADPMLCDNFLLHAAEGNMLLKLNQKGLARSAYTKARTYAQAKTDRKFLTDKIKQC